MFIVTGANGFIGSALVWEIQRRSSESLIAVDTADLKTRPEPLRKARIDDFVLTPDLFSYLKTHGSKVRGVFHMGASSSTTEMNEQFLSENNVQYSQKLFEFCTQQKIPYIYASSASVYGNGALGFDDQTDTKKFKPMNPYGRSKSTFDIWAMEQKQTPPTWAGLRFFNVYGPHEYHKGEQASVVFKAFKQIRESNRLKLFRSHNPDYKDGMQMRDFVYVKDVTRWMWEIFEKSDFTNGVYNMGFGRARTWLDLAGAAFKAMDKPMQIDWIDIPENVREHYQYYTEAKMDKLLAQKLSAPAWSLEAGVEDYIKNYLLTDEPYL